MQWIVIKTFSFPYEAQIAKTQLEAFGIPVYIENEHTINRVKNVALSVEVWI